MLGERTANFENTIQELHNQLAESQLTNQEKDILIQSLRAQEESLSMFPTTSMYISLVHVHQIAKSRVSKKSFKSKLNLNAQPIFAHAVKAQVRP